MSYTQLKRVTPDGEVLGVEDFQNAHGWAAFIYSQLTEKYLGVERRSWLVVSGMSKRLWALVDDARLDACERIVLALTFDRAWVMAPDVPYVIEALRNFVALHPAGENVSHLLWIAAVLEDEWDGADGLAFYGMSVSEDLWNVDLECETCGQSTDESRPFNVRTDKGAIMLRIDALEDCTEGDKFFEDKVDVTVQP